MKNLIVNDVKPFVGAKDYALSRDFYCALGWEVILQTPDITELQLGECRFYLQNFYERRWCENTMLHISVADTHAWYMHASAVASLAQFNGVARVRAPAKQDYGATVTFVWDPASVLLHFAEY